MLGMVQALMQQKMLQQRMQQQAQQQAAGNTALQGQDPGYDPMGGNPNGRSPFMQAMKNFGQGISPGTPYSGPMASGGGAFPAQYGPAYQIS